jgi:hypothetical protein
LARLRFTSSSSTSMTISARGRSFAWMTFSRMLTMFGVPRTVMVLAVLLIDATGVTARPWMRTTWLIML